MRIGLVSRSCPATGADGIARQRQALAQSLAEAGHEVHLFTVGETPGTRTVGLVSLHTAVRPRYPNPWLPDLPVLDWPLTDAQILWELVERHHQARALDVVDVPFWLAQGSVILEQCLVPVVLWLQTTTRHLIELDGREPRPHESVLLALEKRALDRATTVLGDSQTILDDVQRLYATPLPPFRARVVWPGLNPEGPGGTGPRRTRGEQVRVLVVGRLERRKGTDALLANLPAFLDANPQVTVTFVGSDNSASDGFKRQCGCTYPDAFAARAPQHSERVTFLGRVSDEQLSDAYREADIHLHAARYESFGLVFLEAMRAGLPTVAFDVAGAAEIHSRHSASLVPVDDWAALLAETARLAGDRDARDMLGRTAKARFDEHFTARLMADRTVEVYEDAVRRARPRTATTSPFRLFQVTEALQSPDGVGHIIRSQARILSEMGGVPAIQTIYVQPDLAAETGRVASTDFTDRDAVMLHFYGYSRQEKLFSRLPGPRVVHYHNITPPRYFAPSEAAYEMTARGLAQLPRLAAMADVVTGDSWFNVREFAKALPERRPALCLYPMVDRDRLLALSFDQARLGALMEQKQARPGEITLLFVGRLAPNKRQDLLVAAARRLASEGDRPVRLVLIGGGAVEPRLQEQLDLATGHVPVAVEVLTGVTDGVLYAYYRVADVYLSASEHEGFGIPLVEAMAFGVPVVAAANAAVPETLGGAGVMLPRWDECLAAEAAARLATRGDYRQSILDAQDRNLVRFSEAALRAKLAELVAYLRDGILSPSIKWTDELEAGDSR